MEKNNSKKLLLVEDEAIIAMSEKRALEKCGYNVRSVQSGEQAVDAVEKDPEIDLVLMDIDLGSGLSGDQAAEEILKIRHLPIVFLTSHTEREYVERVKEITRYGYVIKNSGEFVLWDTIEVAFELFEAKNRYEEANRELKEANDQLERFFSVNLDLLCIADMDGNFVKVNRAWEEVLGHTSEELLKSKFLDFIHPDDMQPTLDALERLSRQSEVIDFVNRYRTKNGSYRFIEWRSHPADNLIYAAARDITDRVEYEKALRESERAYRSLFERAPIGVFRSESCGKPISMNTAMAQILGLESPKHALEHYTDLGSQVYARKERRQEFVETLQEHGYVQDFESEAVRADGQHIWLSINARKSKQTTKKGFEIDGFAFDITERKKNEQAIKESETRFRGVVENAPDAIFVQTNLVFSYVNQAAMELFGATDPKELLVTPVVDRFHEDDRDQVRRRIKKLNEERIPVPRMEETCLKLDGTEVPAEVSAAPLDYDGGRGALVFIRDITKEKELERKQQRAAEECETVFNVTQDAMFLVNVEGDRFSYIRNNRSHRELTGLTLDDIRGKTPKEVLGEKTGETVREHYRACVAAKQPISYEETLDLPAGERTWATTLTPAIRDGQVDQIVGSSQDISERKHDQQQIEALLAEKNLLLKEVHHRIKNNMHTMMSLLSLEGQATDDPGARRVLRDAGSRLQSMEVLYEKLYQSGQYQEMPLSEYLPPLIDDVVSLSPKSSGLTVHEEIEPLKLDIKSLSAIGLITTELITNALKHGFRDRDRGTISVSATRLDGEV